jgi:predicted nucleic acid-binding protein
VIVVDASAMVEALVGRNPGEELLTALAGDITAPHLLDVEVLSVLRGLTLSGKLETPVADRARQDHFSFEIARYDTAPFADRMWALRHRYTAYDASYLALAEALDIPLLTCDGKLDSGGHDARVVLIAPAGR